VWKVHEDEGVSSKFISEPNGVIGVIEFGQSASSLNLTATATTYGYSIPPTWSWTLHTVTVSGLVPGTVYYYRVGSAPDAQTAPTFTAVMSCIAPSANPQPTRIIFVGDMGTSLSGTGPVTAKRLAADASVVTFDAALIAGDLAYMYIFEPVWDAWFRSLEPLASHVPIMVHLA
jgi:hypothetical protein